VVGDYTVTIFVVIFVKKRAIVTISKSSTEGKERRDVAHDSPAACSCSPSESIQCPCWYINNFVIYFRAHSLHGVASILAFLPVVKDALLSRNAVVSFLVPSLLPISLTGAPPFKPPRPPTITTFPIFLVGLVPCPLVLCPLLHNISRRNPTQSGSTQGFEEPLEDGTCHLALHLPIMDAV
jgi:hypothetical protein